MKKEYKRTLSIIVVILLIVVNFAFFWIGYQSFMYPKLSEFSITNVESVGEALVLNVTSSNHATKYEAKVLKDDEVVYQTTSDSEAIPLTNFTANYNETFTIDVVAYNKNDEKIKSTNQLLYTYQDATFLTTQDHYVTENQDMVLYLDGYDFQESYTVELLYNQNKIYECEVNGADIVIPRDVVEGYSGRITAHLKNSENRIISTFNFYLNTPVVGKLTLLSPNDGYRTRWNDVTLEFLGGENANHFYANLYVGDTLVNRLEVPKYEKSVVIPASAFSENTDYRIVLEAVYEDYVEIAETLSVNVSIGSKETTNPVYVSHNPTFIRAGTKVELKSRTNHATIYYTTDGSDPTTSSAVYKEPFVIQENMTIKTFAVSDNRYDSVINTYNFQVRDKNLVIYLSPSNQNGNYGVESTGFTTEMEIMNQIADVVERTLKNNGVIVYRNYPSGDINAWVAASNYVRADFHLAIHSNASASHEARGIEIYVDDAQSNALSIATNIYNNLWSIYPGNNVSTYNRGVKYANGSLGEVNDDFLPTGALIEVAYHDQYDDALWIMKNINTIGENIANSILSYYN